MTYFRSVDKPSVIFRLDAAKGWFANDSRGWQEDPFGSLPYYIQVNGEGEPIDVTEALEVLEYLGAVPDDLD
jgi:hypothetical protein